MPLNERDLGQPGPPCTAPGPSGRPPDWAFGLAAAVGVAVGIWLVGRTERERERAAARAELAAAQPERVPGRRLIHLAGRRGVGKSSLANALLGTDAFGPTAPPDLTAQYDGDWDLRELPAAAMKLRDGRLLNRYIDPDDVIVLVVDRLARADDLRLLEILERELPRTPRLVLLNKVDLLARNRSRARVAELRSRVRVEVARHLDSAADAWWGSADGPTIDVAEFRRRLDALLTELDRSADRSLA